MELEQMSSRRSLLFKLERLGPRRSLNVLLLIGLIRVTVFTSRAVYSHLLVSSLSIAGASVTEGDGSGTVSLDFVVTLSPADPTQTVTVDYRTNTSAENLIFGSSFAATASPDPSADYQSQMGTLTFNVGENTA